MFVTRGVPGDHVRARVEAVRKGYVRARPDVLLTPSPDRRDPPCPLFAACGGCAYQHVAYDAQLRLKADILRESLERAGRPWPEPIEVVPSPERGWRTRVRLHLEQRDGRFRLGLLRGGVAPRGGPRLLPPDVARAAGRRAGHPRRLRRAAPSRARGVGGGARGVRRRARARGGLVPRGRSGGRHRPLVARERRALAHGSRPRRGRRERPLRGSRGRALDLERGRGPAVPRRTCCRSSRRTATCSTRS